MSKKSLKAILRISALVLTAGLILLASCEQPTNLSESYQTTNLAKPELTVNAWKGANVLSWTPVAHASTYVVYRRDEATKLVMSYTVSGQGLATSYVDKMSFNNQLRHDAQYTYWVEARVTPVGNSASQYLVASVSDSKGVKANIPARTESPVVAPADAAIMVEPYVVSGTDMVRVYWDVGSDEKAREDLLFSYNVYYSFGDPANATTLPLVEVGDTTITAFGRYTKYVSFPLFGGNGSFKIEASWGTSDDYNSYYASAITADKVFNGVKTVLGNVTNISAPGGLNLGKTKLGLTWNLVSGATGYDVYKAELSGGTVTSGTVTYPFIWDTTLPTPPTPPTPGAQALQNYTITGYKVVTGSSYADATTVHFTDTDYDDSKDFLYIVVAKNGAARSAVPALYAKAKTPVAATSATVAASLTHDMTGDIVVPVIMSNLPVGGGYEIKLYRAPLTRDANANVTLEGDYIELTGFDQVGASATYFDKLKDAQYTDGLVKLTSYRYKVVVSKGDITQQGATDFTTAPFTTRIAVPTITTNTANVPVYSFTVNLQNTNLGEFDEVTRKVYYAKYVGGTQISDWTQIDADVNTPAIMDDFTTDSFVWSVPDSRVSYSFKQIIASKGTTLDDSSNATSTVAAPRLPVWSNIVSGTNSPNNEDTSNGVALFILTTIPAPTPATPLDQDATYLSLQGAKIYRAIEPEPATTDFGPNPAPWATVQFSGNTAVNNAGGITGATVNPWTFYIIMPKGSTLAPTAAIGDTQTWRFGIEAGNGNITTTGRVIFSKTSAATATTPLGVSTVVDQY
jgi:hypothetical protein